MYSNYKLILASASPRRQQFFQEMGLDFDIQIKSVDEIFPDDLRGAEITDFLAELKAKAFTDIQENEIVITSDTIVWLENKALGKPKDAAEAVAMLKSLSGKTHEVITSVCFKTAKVVTTLHEITKVTFRKLSKPMIEHYVATYKPMDKAGSYGIQEWIGLVGIEKIEGSYTNVVGLPTSLVYNFLTQKNG
uniref:Maf-like protein n=1 Tax=Flavobacterium sp. TaxID=239 RepID=UPI00404A6C56